MLANILYMDGTVTYVNPMIDPPPSPWNALAMINQLELLAAPHSAEKTVKITMAAYSIGFLPMMSETRPLNGVWTVEDSI